MSLVATCPECLTLFRVVADQLKLHNGIVRCGACNHVFNAAERISFISDDAIASRRMVQEHKPTGGQTMRSDLASFDAKIDATRKWQSVAPPSIQEAVGMPPTAARTEGTEQRQPPSPATPSAESDPEDTTPLQPNAAARADVAMPDFAAQFIAREQDKQQLQRSRSRMVWSACVFFSVLLAGQLAYVFRAELAAWQPAFKPALQVACEYLNCSVSLPSQASAIALDALQIERLGDTRQYQISLTLHNLSRSIQKPPHLELAITDLSGNVNLRKTLPPEQWLPDTIQRGGLPPGAELPVRFGASIEGAVVGFTGVVFYPRP
jgi:predicted Zn finger-like uncharacterized protein